MPFTLTDGRHLYSLEMFLRNILMIGLFRSNNRMVIFSKPEISCRSKHVRDHIFMTSTWKGDSHIGVLKLVTYLQILLFLNKKAIDHFCRWKVWAQDVGGHKIGHFL